MQTFRWVEAEGAQQTARTGHRVPEAGFFQLLHGQSTIHLDSGAALLQLVPKIQQGGQQIAADIHRGVRKQPVELPVGQDT